MSEVTRVAVGQLAQGDGLPRRVKVSSVAKARLARRSFVPMALGTVALKDAWPPRSTTPGVSCYRLGRRTRYQNEAKALSAEDKEPREKPSFDVPPLGPGAKVVSRALASERVKLERAPTVAESEYAVVTSGRPDGEVIAVQLMPGGKEISLTPFVEGFREPEGQLGRAAGRLLEGTAGLQLVTAGRWIWRLQLSRRYRNNVFDGVVGSEVGAVLLRRF